MSDFWYHTSCVQAKGDDINDMRHHSGMVEVTYQTMRRHCVDLMVWARSMGYDRWLPLSKDPIVSYHKSTYRGKLCYYLVHSAIEHIWLQPEEGLTYLTQV